MYLKELLQKPILSLYEGEILGNISKIYIDKDKYKIKQLEIIGENDILYQLQPKFIYTIGKHAITIKNKQNLILSLDEPSNLILPLGVKAYSIQGEYLGVASDYVINEKYGIENIVLDNERLLNISDLASCSTNSIVVYDSSQHINIKSFRYRIQNKSNETAKVKILPKMFNSLNKISQVSNKKNNFMIGRICTQDIFDNKQNLIIKQNSTITSQSLAIASNCNKLNELIKFSKPK